MEYKNVEDCVERQGKAYPDLYQSLLDHSFQRRRISSVSRFVKPDDIVVDIGCNSGYFSEYAPQAGAIHGVDVNPALVHMASLRLTTAQVARAESLPFEDKSADFVHLGGMLELVFDAETVYAEAARVSRRSIAGTTPTDDGSWGVTRVPHHPWHLRSWSEAGLRALLEQHGTIVNFGNVDGHVFFFEVHV